jgi:flotillin
VIAPAEAQRQADIAQAEGQRQAAILAVQAEAEAARVSGQNEADACKAAADALRVEQQAEADGIQAKLVAEATGKKEIAAALNTYGTEAARLQTLPDVLASVVKATEAAAAPLGEIERLSIIGGAGDTRNALGGLLGISPLAIANIVETLKSSGIDLASPLTRPDSTAAAQTNSHTPSQSDTVIYETA